MLESSNKLDPSILGNIKKINLISGKGGVGRTTLTIAMAKASAEQGKKTLIMEIEDDSGWSSPLARHFGQKAFTIKPQLLSPNLYGMTLSAQEGQEKFLTSFLKLQTFAHKVLSNQGVRWFLDGAPAFREMGYFYQFLLSIKEDFDVLILDLPATGHLVGLVRLPRLLLKLMPVGPIAEKLREGQSYMYDPLLTSAWVVTLPQILPVSEALELKTALSQEQIPMGGFILNRVPFNPFTEEEEKILRSLSQKSQTSRLMVDLERIRRFRDAEKRLLEEGHSPVWLAPEVIDPLESVDFCKQIKLANA